VTAARRKPLNLKARFLSPLAVALFLLNAVALGAIVIRAWKGDQTASILATPLRPFHAETPSAASVRSVADLSSIRDQALFYTNRQFYVAPEPIVAAAVPPRPSYRLAGVFGATQKGMSALLLDASGGSRKVRAGDVLDGWNVKTVATRRVVLEYASETVEITTDRSPGTAVGMTAPPIVRTAQVDNVSRVHMLGNGTVPTSGNRVPGNAVRDEPRVYRPPTQ
jgi:type II secretory pathway component PulC